jgi:hypothetical protein
MHCERLANLREIRTDAENLRAAHHDGETRFD